MSKKSYVVGFPRIGEKRELKFALERNDMVEYFGEQLDGFGFSQNSWV